MTPEIHLSRLTVAERDALILSLLPLVGQLEAALARIAELQARNAHLEARLAELERPRKTPDNSSLPPSKGQKPECPAGPKPPRPSRPGVGRTLHPDPDRVVEARLSACPNCAAAFAADRQSRQLVHDRIELPVPGLDPGIRPDVTRVRLFGGRCACRGERATATGPAGLEPGSPFGQSIAALVVYPHYAQAIGLERLATLLGDIFGLAISEGAISNLLARARGPLVAAAAAIQATVTAGPVVCSDETPAFAGAGSRRGSAARPPPSRGQAMLGSQRGHAVQWQSLPREGGGVSRASAARRALRRGMRR